MSKLFLKNADVFFDFLFLKPMLSIKTDHFFLRKLFMPKIVHMTISKELHILYFMGSQVGVS